MQEKILKSKYGDSMKNNLTPLTLAHEIKENILGYLETTYNIRNKKFSTALQTFLNQNLCHPPYIDIKLPFKFADQPANLDLTPPFRLYQHQLQAMHRLSSKNQHPQNTIITTGTGSGKSECFFIPIIDHCLRQRQQRGIKAIIVYPMNALANDQASRVSKFLFEDQQITPDESKLPLVSAGMLIGEEHGQHKGSKIMYKTHQGEQETYHIIDDRQTLIDNPPDILLTNYKMLDYLLMKPKFANLWQQPATLQYLVLDEMHTYDGAQGADVAFLLRRLKAKLNINDITCVGTSATLVSGTHNKQLLSEFAEKLFGSTFNEDCLITENRQSATEIFQTINSDLNKIPPDNQELDYRQYQTLTEYIEAQTTIWFAKTITNNHELAGYLQRHILTKTIIEIFAELGKPMTEQSLLEKLQDKGYTLSSTQLASYLTLLVHANKNDNQPLYHVRIQLWLRELRRLLVSLDNDNPKFVWQEDIDENNKQAYLPPVFCEECGEVGYLSANKQDELVLNDINTIYKQYALRDEQVRYLFLQQDPIGSHKIKICSTCAYVESEEIATQQHDSCPHDQGVWQHFSCYQAISEENKRDKRQCPSCDTNDSLRLVASRVTTLSSVINSQLYLSTSNPQQSKKLLVFSDAVQDASHRSGYYNARTYRFNFRTAMQSFLKDQQQTISFNEASEQFFTYWQKKIGRDKAVATFTPSDLSQLSEYNDYFNGKPEAMLALLNKRIAWEFYLEYALRSQVGRTLEKTLCSAIFINTDLAIAIDTTYDQIASNYEVVRHSKQQNGYRAFALGIIKRLLMKGGIALDVMQAYRHEENAWKLGKNNHDQLWISNLPRGRMQRGSDTGALPKFLSTNINSKVFERVHAAKNNSNWHSLWLMKIFDWQDTRFNPSEFHHIYTDILIALRDVGILHEVHNDKKDYRNFGVAPERLAVSTEVHRLQCGKCYHKIVTAEQQLELWRNLPCLTGRCDGNYQLQTEISAEQKYYRRIYQAGEVERVFAHEHTGLLGRKKREVIEGEFKTAERRADAINLLSCTPTLEMGIDIGDLSATVVASLPRNTSNYQQQIGRAGRKSGVSLVVAIAQAKPRDLLHFQDPQQLIAGVVTPPSCFLNAVDLLRRQVFAYLFDTCFEQIKGANELKLQTLRDEFLQKTTDNGIMLNLQKLLDEQGNTLLQNFKQQLQDKISKDTWQDTQNYFLAEADNIVKKLHATVANYDRLLAEIEPKLTEVIQEINKLTTMANLNDEQTAKLRELRREQAGLRAQKESIGNEDEFFAFLTRNGFLPNYAFQEQAVELKGVIIDSRAGEKNVSKEIFERPAKMALREFAPGNTFYGGGYKMQIDQLNIGTQKKTLIEEWRACHMCGYLAPYREDERTNCPKCNDHMWSDEGQKLKMLKVAQMVSVEDSLSSHVGDEADERNKKIFRVKSYFDIDKNSVQKTLAPNNDFAFGIEFLSRMKLREINFGEEKPTSDQISIAGDKQPRGFVICNRCGRLQEEGSSRHTTTCPYRKHTTNIDQAHKRGHEQLVLFRELHSEAIRVLLPVSEYDSEIRVSSIKAALMLGFQEKFGGKPLHLEIEEQKVIARGGSNMPRRYLVMFDAVPGGTGFLRDLWNKDSFFELVERAYQKIIACACKNDPARNGCLHCVFNGISQFEIPQVKRDEAEKYLHSILENKNYLHETRVGLEDIRIDSVLDSDLEYRFVALLKECATGKYHNKIKESGLEIKDYEVLDKHGIKFSIKYGNHQQQYTMLAQQPLNEGENRTVCDFIFKPDTDDSETFALYLDGFEYHASASSGNRFQTDFSKRHTLCNGNEVKAVWNLTWQDLNDFEKPNSQRTVSYLGQKISHEAFSDNHFLLLLKLLAGYRLDPRDWKDFLENKGKKIKINENFVEHVQTLEVDAEIIDNIEKLAAHDPKGLLHTLYLKDNKFLLAYLVNRETRARTTMLSTVAPLSVRNTNEFFLHWQSFLHTWNIAQMFSDKMISKVWAEVVTPDLNDEDS